MNNVQLLATNKLLSIFLMVSWSLEFITSVFTLSSSLPAFKRGLENIDVSRYLKDSFILSFYSYSCT